MSEGPAKRRWPWFRIPALIVMGLFALALCVGWILGRSERGADYLLTLVYVVDYRIHYRP